MKDEVSSAKVYVLICVGVVVNNVLRKRKMLYVENGQKV